MIVDEQILLVCSAKRTTLEIIRWIITVFCVLVSSQQLCSYFCLCSLHWTEEVHLCGSCVMCQPLFLTPTWLTRPETNQPVIPLKHPLRHYPKRCFEIIVLSYLRLFDLHTSWANVRIIFKDMLRTCFLFLRRFHTLLAHTSPGLTELISTDCFLSAINCFHAETGCICGKQRACFHSLFVFLSQQQQ